MTVAPGNEQQHPGPMPDTPSKRPLIFGVVIGLAMIGILAFLMLLGVVWLLIQRDGVVNTSPDLLNQPAPAFQVRTLDNESVRLADLRGQPVWLSFWAVWCGPCLKEMPAIAEARRDAEANGVRLLVVNTGEPEKTVRTFLRENPYPGLPVALDENGSTGTAYQVYSLPTNVYIDAQGIVRAVKVGTMDADEMRAAIKDVR